VRVGWLSRSSFNLEYRLEVSASALGTARVIADGSTVQVFYDLRRGRPMRTPPDLMHALSAYEGRALPSRASAG
jgi:acyl-CoA thioesterase FadM